MITLDSKMTVRSCCSHIATKVAKAQAIPPHRMQLIEHYPQVVYGEGGKQQIPLKFDVVELVWEGDKALHPKWRPLEGPLFDFLANQYSEPSDFRPEG